MTRSVRVKICGVRSVDELKVVENFADFTGVVVDPKSKRFVDLRVAKEIVENSAIPVFLVSTTSSVEEWEEIICKSECGFVQVHNSSFDAGVLRDYGVKVMQAFMVNACSSKIAGEVGRSKADFALLDSGCGSGRAHDWDVSSAVVRSLKDSGYAKPIFLAGGLRCENVRRAIEVVKPDGVDVSSGVERNGRKDRGLIEKFVSQINSIIYKMR